MQEAQLPDGCVLNEITWEAERSPIGPVFSTLFLEFFGVTFPQTNGAVQRHD